MELGVGLEELGLAGLAPVDAGGLGVGVLADERALGAGLAQHVVLLGRELLAPLLVGLLHLVGHASYDTAPTARPRGASPSGRVDDVDQLGTHVFTEPIDAVTAEEGGCPAPIPWERVRKAGDKLTTPLLPDDYLTLLNPLWSSRELRGRVEKVVPETEDAATLVIRPGWGWRYDHRPGQYVGIGVQVGGKFHWRSYSVSSPPQNVGPHPRDHGAGDARGLPLRPPRQRPRARHDRAAGRCPTATSCCPTRRRRRCCSWSAAAGSPR